jgi:hypothetical protein
MPTKILPFKRRDDERVKELLRIRHDRSLPFERRLKAATMAALFGARKV